MSVAISFENMVYEDALTILSYASPYPVKVTLQKQKQMPKHRRLSEVKTNLNHPLYRSQSVDAVNVVPKESYPSFHAKRSASEMRHDRRNSPKVTRTSKLKSESDIIEESSTNNKDEVFHKNVPITKDNNFVQRRKSDKDHLTFDREVSIPTETDLPLASVDLNIDDKKEDESPPFTDAFEHLTEEDKLDVLRLTYDDPNQVINKPFEVQKQVVEAEINHQALNADLKCAPVKPERKKKPSSSNSTPSHSDVDFSDSNLSSPRLDKDNSVEDESPQCPDDAPPPIPDDVFEISLAPPTEAPPPLPENFDISDIPAPSEPPPPVPDNEPEAEEDFILPQKKERDVSLNTNAIVFETMTPTKHDVSDVSIDRTVVGDTSFSDHSFSDVDTTLVKSPASRPESPDGDGVEEEQISATQIKKSDILFNSSNVFVQSDDKAISNEIIRERTDTSSSSSSENDTNVDTDNDRIEANVQESVQQSDDDFEKDLPKLDMNLNFDNFGSDSVLFKETFPNRHERESDGGMAYDISVTELESMEQKFRDDEREKNQNQIGKGGIAFEVREGLESGNTRTVNTNSVHRTSSYEFKSSRGVCITRESCSRRPTSLKGDLKHRDEVGGGVLDWSGKRLVRSGSFTEIPQDDSIKDWTDEHNLNEDDSLIEKHIEEDANSPALKPLTRATQFQSNQTRANLSDSDSQCRSLSSSSSSRSSSPNHMDNYHGTNGEDDGLGMSPDNSPIKISPTPDIKSELKSSVSKYGENEQAFTVTLNTAEDEDC